MLTKKIQYTDYNGNARNEEFLFNLSEAEIMEMELGTTGTMSEMLKRISAAQDIPSLVKIFREILLKSYGVKSDDGKRFIKSEELSEAFSQTEAYSKLMMELYTDADAAAKFVNALIPQKEEKKATSKKVIKPKDEA